jgi:hypothetical protein
LKARPVNMKNNCVLESDVALDVAGAEFDGTVPFVRAMLSVITKAPTKFEQFGVNEVTIPWIGPRRAFGDTNIWIGWWWTC